MKDVAAEAGVSLKTVSRVVNGEPGVALLTGQRVREAIETLGFRRNDSARLLRTGQAATVGLVMEDIGDPFYSALLRGVESVARARGSLVLSGSSEADAGTEHELALALCARRVPAATAGSDTSATTPTSLRRGNGTGDTSRR
jgi:LacI family transcriptional regulator